MILALKHGIPQHTSPKSCPQLRLPPLQLCAAHCMTSTGDQPVMNHLLIGHQEQIMLLSKKKEQSMFCFHSKLKVETEHT
jgi:hypothetical protein